MPARMAGLFHLARPARRPAGFAEKQPRMLPGNDEPGFQILQLPAHLAAELQQRAVAEFERRQAPVGPCGEWYLIRHDSALLVRAGRDLSLLEEACKSCQRYRLYGRHSAGVRGSEGFAALLTDVRR